MTTFTLPDGEAATADFALDGQGGVMMNLSAQVSGGQSISGYVDLNPDGLSASVSVPVLGAEVTMNLGLTYSGDLSAAISVPIGNGFSVAANIDVSADGITGGFTSPPIVTPITVSTVASGTWSYFGNWSSSYYYAEVANETVDVIDGFISGVDALAGIISDAADLNAVGIFQNALGVVDAVAGQRNNTAFAQGPSNTLQYITGAIGNVTPNIPIETTFDVVIEPTDTITLDQSNVEVNSLTIEAGGELQTSAANNASASLHVDDSLANAGTIDVQSSTSIQICASTNIGVIKADGGSIGISGPMLNEGQIEIGGGGNVTVSGTITQNGPSAIIDGANGSVTVSGEVLGGSIEASGGDLWLYGTTGSGVTIVALDGSTLDLGGTTVVGGTLETDGTGVIDAYGGTLDGTTSPVTIEGEVDVPDYGSLTIQGAIDNLGSIVLNSPNSDARLFVGPSGATLSGGGSIVLDGSGDEVGGSASTLTTLTNVDNTISGSGVFGFYVYTVGWAGVNLVNEAAGVIDGNGGGLTLGYESGTLANAGLIEGTSSGGLAIYGSTTNTGTIEANGGNLSIYGNLTDSGILQAINGGTLYVGVGGTVATTSGAAIVAQAGSTVELGGTIAGGSTLETSSTGVIDAYGGVLDGTASPVTIEDTVEVPDYGSLTMQGAIDNLGSIVLNSPNAEARLLVGPSGATLSGGGSVVLDGSGDEVGGANGSLATLTNVNNTISGTASFGVYEYGAGWVGVNLVNDAAGVIDGNGSGLSVGLYSGSLANAGLVEGTSTGGLTIYGSTTNTGTIEANGGNLSIYGNLTDSGILQAINGGTLYLYGTTTNGSSGVITAAAGSTVDLAASLTGGSIGIAAGGVFNLQGSGLSISGGVGANVFNNAGVLNVSAGSGIDTIGFALNNTGRIDVMSGTLDLTGGGFSSGSNIYVASGATLEIGAGTFALYGGSIQGGGSVVVTGSGALAPVYTLTTGVDTINGGSFDNTFAATTGTLSRGDKIKGGGATNILELIGGGVFNLAAPTSLTNIQIGTATEGSGAAAPKITLCGGLNVTLTLASGTGTNPGATVIGANDASVINLGGGIDTVTVGSARETIQGGGGADLIEVTASTIGATIDGGTGASVLELTTGGAAVMGANITDIHKVELKTAATLTANALSGLTLLGSKSADTLIAGGSGQTLTGGGGADTLVGSAAGGDTFKDTTANLALATIQGFVAGDVIDLTNIKLSKTVPTTALWSMGVLTVAQGAKKILIKLQGAFTGTFSVSSDGSAGIDVTYAARPTAMAQAMAGLSAPNLGLTLATAPFGSTSTTLTSLAAPHG